MRAIAQRRISGCLAAAKERLLGAFRGILHWLKICPLVATIAEGLFLTLAAGAPPICFAFFNIYGIGRFLRNDGIGHFFLFLPAVGYTIHNDMRNCGFDENA